MEPARLLIVGGQQRTPRSLIGGAGDWYDYGKGLMLEVDQSGRIETRLEYVSPEQVRGADDPILFKSATRVRNVLYACTQTEVLLFRLPQIERIGYVSLPCFNDVHHVRPAPDGDLLVANSGLDMVLKLTVTGEVVQRWNVLGEEPWQRFSQTVDYRKGISTKPHRSHPNHVFCLGEEIWVTRFQQKDAICLTHPRPPIVIGLERAHDGLVHEGRIYFTTVDGHVVIVNASTLLTERVVNLNAMHDGRRVLGWCRGIHVEGHWIWIGFSRLRPTRYREHVAWAARGFKHTAPTHVGCYDLQTRTCVAEIDLERHGLNAIFSILPLNPNGAGAQ